MKAAAADRWLGRWISAYRQIAIFGLVSVVTTILDFGLFNLLVWLEAVPAVAANTLSYGLGIIASYLLNKRLTFSGGGRDKRSHELALFVVLNLAGLALNNFAVALAVRVAGETPVLLNAAKLLAGAATWLLKFVTFKRWVYPARGLPAEARTE